jgi:mannose-1-phosphate guanylyltransferase
LRRTEVRIAIIMAGGSGRRFWPLSRDRRPKQLMPLVSGKSLLALTIERLLPSFKPERIWVITRDDQAKAARRIASAHGPIRVISEPASRNTAPCMALGATLARSALGDASLAFLPADHFIADGRGFRAALRAAMEFAEREDALVTLGVKPTRPATGFGYIRKGPLAGRVRGQVISKAARFAEKPSLNLARRYVGSHQYLWNSGIFVCRASVLLREIAEHLPGVSACFARMAAHVGGPREKAETARCYDRVESISLDFGVMEKTRRAFVIPADIGWDDLGNWESFSRYMLPDACGNRVCGRHVGLDSKRCVIYAEDKLVATVGVKDVVVVVAGDAVLLVKRDEAERVKDLTTLIDGRGLGRFL